jgi:hypothetical protein
MLRREKKQVLSKSFIWVSKNADFKSVEKVKKNVPKKGISKNVTCTFSTYI